MIPHKKSNIDLIILNQKQPHSHGIFFCTTFPKSNNYMLISGKFWKASFSTQSVPNNNQVVELGREQVKAVRWLCRLTKSVGLASEWWWLNTHHNHWHSGHEDIDISLLSLSPRTSNSFPG